MIIKAVTLSLTGIFTDSTVLSIPHIVGLYFVYKENKIGMRKLLYIGESDDVNKRLNEHHEKRHEWDLQLLPGEDSKIIYLVWTSQSLVSSPLRKCVENVCIFRGQPILNVQGKTGFRHLGFLKIIFDDVIPAGFDEYFTLFGWQSERMTSLLNLIRNMQMRD